MPLIAGAAIMATHTGDHGVSTAVAVTLALIGVAIVAVLVSQKAQTGAVATAGGTSLANVIKCALSPVTGGTCGGVVTQVASTIDYSNVPCGGAGEPAC